MCQVKGCKENHQNHFCRVCQDYNSNHFSRNCPKGTVIYHGTSKQYADSIVANGFKSSAQGRIGPGVYFTRTLREAKEIANYRFSNNRPVVIECIAHVDYQEFSKEDHEDVIVKKIEEWYDFCKKKANHGIHPPWANNDFFKEVCVKDPNSITVRHVYEV